MPIYEYQCSVCGHEVEYFQKITESPFLTCPHCNKDTLQKLISKSAFQLKGTGWYVTDFKEQKKGAPKEEPLKKEGTENKEAKKEDKKDTQKETKETKETTANTSSSDAGKTT